MVDPAKLAEIDKEFKALDTDGDGFLFFHEITKAVEVQRGFPLTDNEMITLKQAFKAADENHDDKISPEEFQKWKLGPHAI